MTNTHESLPLPFLGCPMWNHPSWKTNGLKDYAQFCNSVEGNTTFYQTPSLERAQEWANSVDDSFRFTLKLPQTITHEMALQNTSEHVDAFWQALQPLQHKVGVLMAQLPASFGPSKLPALEQFLKHYNLPVPLAVEVRHMAFFQKGEDEKAFNQMLIRYGVNRVILDSRALFSRPAQTPIEEDVQSKKPKVPVNVIATDEMPIVRFIGSNHDDENVKAMTPWINKCHVWRTEGRQPYLFFHCPDNGDAPWLLKRFVDIYNDRYPASPLHCKLEALFPSQNQGALDF